jgi:hypothetical protein
MYDKLQFVEYSNNDKLKFIEHLLRMGYLQFFLCCLVLLAQRLINNMRQ